MKSTTAMTREMDDMKKTAEELASQVQETLPLKTGSCGILFCDSEMDHAQLVAELKDRLPETVIVGCTSVANIDGKKGFQDMVASLTVLTADDVRFSFSLSDPITADDVTEKVEEAYKRGAAVLAEPAKLILAFPAYNLNITLDEYPEALDKVSGGVPIFGGLPAANPPYGVNQILADGKVYTDRAAFVLIGGNIQPIFTVQNVLSNTTEQKRPVTHSERNVIYRVGDVSFVDYLRQFGLPVEKIASEPNTTAFVTNPLLVEMPRDDNDDGVPFVRTLHSLDLQEGSGTAIGKIPQGAMISIAVMKRKDVELSTRQAIRNIAKQIEARRGNGYEYSTILGVSCIGRYMIMANDPGVEGRVIAEETPPSIHLSSFYGYGEMGPTSVRNGRAVNRAHNESIVLCAF